MRNISNNNSQVNHQFVRRLNKGRDFLQRKFCADNPNRKTTPKNPELRYPFRFYSK